MALAYDEMSFESFEGELKGDPICILPVGATEEHGKHLPLCSDSTQALYTARALAERVKGLVLPPISYGVSSSLKDFPGTLSISFDALRLLVRDILKELIRNGVRKIVVISSHGAQAHMSAIRTACEEVADLGDVKLMALCDYEIAYRLRGTGSIPIDDGHGGVVETSRMLALAPELVGEARPSGKDSTPSFLVSRHKRRYMTEGIIGESSKATADLGKQINSYVIEELVKAVRAVM